MRYDTPRHRTRVRFLAVRRQIPFTPCRRAAQAEEHAGTGILAGPALLAEGVGAYRLHAVGSMVTVLLLDAEARFRGAVTLEVPEKRRGGTRIRYLQGFHLWEILVTPERLELEHDRARRGVLWHDASIGLWIGDTASAELLDEAARVTSVLGPLLEELAEKGVLDLR